MQIINKSKKIKSNKIYNTIKNFINNLPEYTTKLLNEYNTKIIIADLNKELNYSFSIRGCYQMHFKDKNVAYIYINDNNSTKKIPSVLSHEIGHFLDDVLGCYKNNVKLSKENIIKFSLSLTDENINFFIKKESDFFTQIKRNENKDESEILLEIYDIKEEFANCISEILTHKRKFNMPATKQNIIDYIICFKKEYTR